MPDKYRPFTSSLRSRLLVLTILFAMVVQVLVYLPSVANFRQSYLEERLSAAQIAALSLEEAPNNSVSLSLEQELLNTAGVIAIIMRREDKSFLLGIDVMPEEADAIYDLRAPSLGALIRDAFITMEHEGNRVIRVIGSPTVPGTRYLEITLDEQGLYESMTSFSNNALILSVVVSLFTGILVYLALHWLVVRPMRILKSDIVRFRERPETPMKASRLGRRRDEIGVVERELKAMQAELRKSLHQKTRLAELGEALAKINHDLRNILSSARLASDTLANSKDPRTARTADRLIRAVGRAISLCERTIRHGKASEPEPDRQMIALKPLALDVGGSLELREQDSVTFHCPIEDDLQVYADPEQLHRVLLNLCRNARDAQAGQDNATLVITAVTDEENTTHIRVMDSGPGLPDHARENLFKPFVSSKGRDGTGLGLAIAREIVLAHGGTLVLEETGPEGTVFLICLPGPSV
ncbi:sensor histidine kinase [Yunchengibacter salinarum]|uniref:sensor histidine kinase n=1 Tax=Yunchengibacter salinarum TaxID=3133399 RepID=UPI0035B5AA23